LTHTENDSKVGNLLHQNAAKKQPLDRFQYWIPVLLFFSAMRKNNVILFFAVILWGVCHATNPTLKVPESPLVEVSLPLSEEDEVKVIDELIATTASQLEMERDLKETMLEFKKLREEFIQGNQTKIHTVKLIRAARQIYEKIASNHLEHLFAKDYLDELSFFSSIAGKNAVSRP
jgi:hypothetical protein